MNFTIPALFLCSLIILTKSDDYENLVDGSYRKVDKFPNNAELHQKSERNFTFEFFDMTFKIIVDLPLNINGLKPHSVCPEIIFTLFLQDSDKNLYQCDASEVVSDIIALVCQQLENSKHAECPGRHRKVKPLFLEKLRKCNEKNTNTSNESFFKFPNLTQIFIIFCMILLLIYVYKLHQNRYVDNNHHNHHPGSSSATLQGRNNKNTSTTSLIDHQAGDSDTDNELSNSRAGETRVEIDRDAVPTTNNLAYEDDDAGFDYFSESEMEHSNHSYSKNVTSKVTDEKNQVIQRKNILKFKKAEIMKIRQMLRAEKTEMEQKYLIQLDNETYQTERKNLEVKMQLEYTKVNDEFQASLQRLRQKFINYDETIGKPVHIVSFEKDKVMIFDTKNKSIASWPAKVDYSFNPPRAGINYSSPTVVSLNINGSNKTIGKEFWDLNSKQRYAIDIKNKSTTIDTPKVVADILQNISESRNIGIDIIAFKIQPSISENIKQNYIKAVKEKHLDNIKLIDEQLLIGKTLVDGKRFILLNFCNKSLVISLFENKQEECRKVINDINAPHETYFLRAMLEGASATIRKIQYDYIINTINMLRKKMMVNLVFITRNSYIYEILIEHYRDTSLKLEFVKEPEKLIVKNDDILSSCFDSKTSNSKLNESSQKQLMILIDETTATPLWKQIIGYQNLS